VTKINLERKGDERRSARIHSLLHPLLEELGIAQQYQIFVGFADEVDSPHKQKFPDPEDKHCIAVTSDAYPGHEIRFHMERTFVDDAGDERLLEACLHEALHTVPFGGVDRLVTSILKNSPLKDDEWACLSEEMVDLVALWLTRLWLRKEKLPSRSTRTTAKTAAK
jgi:hypothetical protein